MIGQSLGAFTIDRELGAGGMGQVFQAHTAREVAGLAPGTTVALKVVHPHLLETEGFFKRFLREADLGRSITHENVVRTLDCDQLVVEGQVRCFLVMEFVEGQTLGELLAELEQVPEELCRHVAREICKGLAAVHEAGIVQRDLKPENVLITPDQVVKLMDLGVAKLADEQLRLSRTGAFVGSACYAAPEQFGGETDHRSDLHALGVLLYELATGALPYGNDDFRSVMRRVCAEEPRRLGDRNPQLSAFFEEVVHTLLAKEPDERFESAAALLEVLEEGERSEWWRERARQIQATTKRPIRRIRIPRETAVHGREDELAKLRGLFDQAIAGEGAVVLLEGEAGIGKSRLIDELVARLQADGEDLNFLFGSYPPGGAATAAGGFSSAYREQFGEAGSAPYLSETPLLVPGFDAVLRGESAPADSLQLNSDSLATCFVHATRALAAERPTIVLIDDLHFAPDEARRLFTALAQAVPGHGILLVGTLRPGVPEDWLANLTRLDQVTRLELQRLGPKDLVALLKDSLGSTHAAEQLSAKIAVKSDGNPFFAFEILRGLKEGQFLKQSDDGTWMTTQIIDEIQIPSSVLDLVNARVADLTEDERDLLDVAACWGYEFDPTLVGEVVGLKRIAVLKTLSRVERKHRLVRSVGRRFQFDHHQVQEALYQSLPEMLREDYHAALAEALEEREGAAATEPDELDGALCVDLCEHFLDGAQPKRALRYLQAAQAHLAKGYMHAQYVTLTDRMLEIPGLIAGAERARILFAMADEFGPLDSMGARDVQEARLREAESCAEQAGDAVTHCRALNVRGFFITTSPGRLDEAEACIRRARDIARDCGDRYTEAFASGNLGHVHTVRSEYARALELHETQRSIAKEIGEAIGEANAVGNIGRVYWRMGEFHEARRHGLRALELQRACGNQVAESSALNSVACYDAALGHRDAMRRGFEQSLELARQCGHRRNVAFPLGNLGITFFEEDRLVQARTKTAHALEIAREVSPLFFVASLTGTLGSVALLAGDVVAADEHLRRSLELASEAGAADVQVTAWIRLSSLAADAASAESRLDEAVALSVEKGARPSEVSSRLELGALRARRHRSAGLDASGAIEELARALELSRELGDVVNETLALCELAALPGGDVEAAATALTEHEERLGRPAQRRARLLLWMATGDQVHLVAAKELLDEALARVPDEYHEPMLTNVRVNREILEAWREELGEDGGTESVTRVGRE